MMLFVISITASGVYSYFTYEQNYTLDSANVSIEYAPIHNITFIIDSKLNDYTGEENIFLLSTFPNIAVTSGKATKVGEKYTFSTTYKEGTETEFGVGFKINGNRFVQNIRHIRIPTWKDLDTNGEYPVNYPVDYTYNDIQFNKLADGGDKGNPSLTVDEDSSGNVTVTIRMVEKDTNQ